MNSACPVCNALDHSHCSAGCERCDDPRNPYPHYAQGRCIKCGLLLCPECMEHHECEIEKIKRTNLNTGLYRLIPLSVGFEELASKTSARDFPSRLDLLARLCEGTAVEVGVYSYELE